VIVLFVVFVLEFKLGVTAERAVSIITNANRNKVTFVCFIMLSAFILQKAVKTLSVLNDDCTR
jgi:hypothetical protein